MEAESLSIDAARGENAALPPIGMEAAFGQSWPNGCLIFKVLGQCPSDRPEKDE
jgi:hypothetical protein